MVVAITMIKDEADIVARTLTQMLGQVDCAIVADNGSTDGTREILEEFRPDIEIVEDPVVGYFQSAKMSRLAARAAEQGATWVVPFDADEWWYSPFGTIREQLESFDGAVAVAEVYDHRATALDPDGDPISRMGWRERDSLTLQKVACRPVLPVTIEQGNHGARYASTQPLCGRIVIRHFPIRSVEQMIRKARNGGAAYAATDLPEDAGAHWRGWGRLTDQQLADVFREHYWRATPDADDDMIFDPAP